MITNARSLTRLALFSTLACALGAATACDKSGDGGSKRKKSTMAKWVDSPKSGTTTGKIVTIDSLGVRFVQPDVLYVYKECGEAQHVPDDTDRNWIPVIRCETSVGGSDDEFSDDSDSESGALTIYAAHKTSVINERTVETFRMQFLNAGYKVDAIDYHEDYLSKPGRRGIESKVHLVDSDSGYPTREMLRFMFPREDVIFVAHIDYPYGDDRSGMMSDWERILWNFDFLSELDPDEVAQENADAAKEAKANADALNEAEEEDPF